MTEHDLKCWPEYYAAIDGGYKTCELRLNDRPYAVGDALLLREFEPVENGYTGRQLRVRVTHILNGGPWLAPGYIAMSIRLMGEDGRARVQEDFRVSYEGEKKRADTFQAAHRMAERHVAELLLARSAADREVGAMVGTIDQAIANLRAIVSLNDDPHIDEICRATADALGALLGESTQEVRG